MYLSLLEGPHSHHIKASGIFNGLLELLYIAEQKTGAKLWVETEDGIAETGGFRLSTLSRVFSSDDSTLDFQIEPKGDLADHIAAVMNDENTPAELYNAMADVLTGLQSASGVREHPDVIRAALQVNKEERDEK